MQYQVINLGTPEKPQFINLRVQCFDDEKASFTKLFKEYKNVFTWSYEYLKMFDTQTMQHIIPIKGKNLCNKNYVRCTLAWSLQSKQSWISC